VNEPTSQPTFLTRWLPLAVILGTGYLLFVTFSPFFSALAWAGLLAYGLSPAYQVVLRFLRGRANLTAFLMCVAVTIGVILPLLYVLALIGEELTRTYRTLLPLFRDQSSLPATGQTHPLAALLLDKLHAYEQVTGVDLRSVVIDNLAQFGTFTVQTLTRMAANVLLGVLQFTFVLLAMFYFFRDGRALIEWLQDILPFPPERQRIVAQRFHEVIMGAVFGNTLIALIEGLAGGLAFWAAGLPAPTLWGMVMAVLAFLPMLGASLVWGPAALYLALQGAYTQAAILSVAGVVIAFLDYVTRTIIIGQRSQLHTLVVFFSVLGGLQVFGLIGIIVGPLISALGLVILERDRTDRVVASSSTLSPQVAEKP
jgi:predicted PurR-regulated permease PerM